MLYTLISGPKNSGSCGQVVVIWVVVSSGLTVYCL